MKNPYKSTTGVRRLVLALGYSLAGLGAAFRHERAFRQVALLAVVLVPVALWLPVGAASRAALVMSVIVVAITELLNSAIEAAVDRSSLKKHPLAKRAKDIASAAVFLSLVNAVLVWTIILSSAA